MGAIKDTLIEAADNMRFYRNHCMLEARIAKKKNRRLFCELMVNSARRANRQMIRFLNGEAIPASLQHEVN